MKKQIAMLLCALTVMVFSTTLPALAAEQHYPVSVEEYTYGPLDELRINKIYQLSLSDDPAAIPTEDFDRNGRHYYLLDMVRKDEVGVDTQPHTETITMDSDTGDLAEVLKRLDAQMEVTTEDGHTGTLVLDHTSVKVEVKGYKTSTRNLSASRTYPNLSDADLSLVPKTVTEGGRTLTLADVKWSDSTNMEGEDVVVRYTATASYTGSVTSRYATGYTVTADYTGEVAKTNCEIVTYTAIFGCTDVPYHDTKTNAPQDSGLTGADTSQEMPPAPQSGPAPSTMLSVLGCAGGIAALLAAGGWSVMKMRERRSDT